MTLVEFITILEEHYPTCLNYQVQIDLDHCVTPNNFSFNLNHEEKIVTIIQGNRGI